MRSKKEIEEALNDDRPVPIFAPDEGELMHLEAIRNMGPEEIALLAENGQVELFQPAGYPGEDRKITAVINDEGTYDALMYLIAEGIDIAITGRVDGDNLIIESVAPQSVVGEDDGEVGGEEQ